MQVRILAVLLLVPLAGCFGSPSEDGGVFSYEAPADPRNEPFQFVAKVGGDRFVWDFGDGRPVAEGREVEHLFAAYGGTTKVRLTVHDGSQVREFDPVTVEIGDGTNQPPEVTMAVAWDWVQVGEPLVISGAGSNDPDGDEVIFSWVCRRESGIAPKTDDHGPRSSGYGDKPVVPVTVLNGANVPAVNRNIQGDICSELSGVGSYSSDATISGSFQEPGIYRINLLGKDATSTSQLGEWTIYVTESARPDLVTRLNFSGNLALPSLGVMESDPTGNVEFYKYHNFSVAFDGIGMAIDLSPDGGALGQNVTYDLLRNGEERISERNTDVTRTDGWLKAGQYTLRVFLRSGIDVDYQFTVDLAADVNPSEFWVAPH